MSDTNVYYLIPFDEITEDIIAIARQTSRDTVRKSIRPIGGRIHGIVSFSPTTTTPSFLSRYPKYSHAEILQAIRSHEWDLHHPINTLSDRYNYINLIHDFESGRIIESFGHMYITIFAILKYKFFIHHKSYLDSEDKWQIFIKGQRFEKSNEYSLLEMNYLYNLITPSERETIERFRTIRNDVTHSFDHSHTTSEMREVISKVNDIIQHSLASLSV